MNQFRQDNTEGFSNTQLAAMNDEFHHDLQIALCDIPNGAAEAAYSDMIAQITQSIAEAVLKRHGAA